MPASIQKEKPGKDPYTCEHCGGHLSHDDWIGEHDGTVFIRKGYHCPHCNYQSIKTYSKYRKIERIRFDWRKLAAPSGLSMGAVSG